MKTLKLHKTQYIKDKKTAGLYLASFLIPCVVMVCCYIRLEIYPFGENSLLSMDLWGQYFPMLKEQVLTRRELALGLFSWNGSLGINSFAQSAYYCNSPFNFLLLLSPVSSLINALDWLILFKFGFASLSMAFFLKHKTGELKLTFVGCACAYALCAYNLAFINQIMWFDAVIFFPVIMVGFERMIIDRKPVLYCLMLALTIYSSFYISFSVCIFLVIYFVLFVIESAGSLGKKGILRATGNFALYSALAGGMAMFIILPVYSAISRTAASEIPAPTTVEFYNSVVEYVLKLFPQTKLSLEFGIPNIYSGGFVLVFLPFFIFNKKISVVRKIIRCVLIVILFFSMDVNIFDYVWHGFHFPNQLPGRWTFIFSFVLITMVAETLAEFEFNSKSLFFISAAAVADIVVIVKLMTPDEEITTQAFVIMLIFTFVYSAILFLFNSTKSETSDGFVAVILCICIVLEVGSNAVFSLASDGSVGRIPKYTQFSDGMEQYSSKYSCDNSDFYRSEMYENWTFNSGQLYDIKSLTYYSSTMSEAAYSFFGSFGQRIYAKNVSTIFNPFSPVLNSVFDIKYIASRNMKAYTTGLIKTGDVFEQFTVLENKYVLPVAFVCDEAALEWEKGSGSYIDNQNSFFAALTGGTEVYGKLEPTDTELENMRFFENKDWTKKSYSRIDSKKPVTHSAVYTLHSDGEIFLCQNYRTGELEIEANGKVHTLDAGKLTHEYLGSFKAGSVITLKYSTSDIGVGLGGMDLYSFDEKLFADEIEKLGATALDTSFSADDGEIKGTLSAKKDSLVFTSLPNIGFAVYVDGVKTDILTVGGYLIAFRISEGEHDIEFRYTVPLLHYGLCVSVVCATAFVAITVIRKKRARGKESEKL